MNPERQSPKKLHPPTPLEGGQTSAVQTTPRPLLIGYISEWPHRWAGWLTGGYMLFLRPWGPEDQIAIPHPPAGGDDTFSERRGALNKRVNM
jgi:hypothetical protein